MVTGTLDVERIRRVQPFLKWAGGKRWLFDRSFVSSLGSYDRYVEPFVGGGAGFFAVEPKRALLSDINSELISLYRAIRDHPTAISKLMTLHQENHSKEYYYSVRSTKPTCELEAAARTLYLNRTCWNGLYRLNKSGKFNVPVGTKTTVCLPTDDFALAAKLLANSELISCDFAETIDRCGCGDLIFVDPPYTVKHNLNGFIKYNENIFRWEDQERLRHALERAVCRGASVVMTNADNISIKKLYENFGRHTIVSRKSVISGKNLGRSTVTELVVRA